MMEEIQQEKARYEDLLLSILPRAIVDRINNGEQMIADQVDAVTILFADIVGFTPMASKQSAGDLVRFLNSIFSVFDGLTERFGGEKIKTIGDAYMVAFGLPDPRPDHAEAAAMLARAMLEEARAFRGYDGAPVNLRIGLHAGAAIAGVIGPAQILVRRLGQHRQYREPHGIPRRARQGACQREHRERPRRKIFVH